MTKKKKAEFLFSTKHTWESEDTLVLIDSELVSSYGASHEILDGKNESGTEQLNASNLSSDSKDSDAGAQLLLELDSDPNQSIEANDDIEITSVTPVSSKSDELRRFKCDKCDKDFLTSSDLIKHNRVHTGAKPFMCRYCGRCFSIRSNLKVHLRSHTGEKPFECELCEAEFAYTHSLNRHVAVAHPGYQPQEVKKRKTVGAPVVKPNINLSFVSNQCQYCGLVFQTADTLALHMKSHTGSNAYQIFTYPPGFTGNVAVQVASTSTSSSGIIQLGEKPLPCGVCGKVFTVPHLLENHMKCHDLMYICNKCDKQFAEKEKLIEHQRSHEMGALKCLYCGAELKDKQELVAHHRKHVEEQKAFDQSLVCPVCARMFSSEKYLVAHMSKHREKKPWQCEYCMFKFFTEEALNAHRATHMLDEEPYICEYCDAKFTETSAFVIHMKTHACDESCKCKHCAKDVAGPVK